MIFITCDDRAQSPFPPFSFLPPFPFTFSLQDETNQHDEFVMEVMMIMKHEHACFFLDHILKQMTDSIQ